MSDDDLARLLVKAAATYNYSGILKAIPPLQEEYIKELHSFGILSVAAMAAIVQGTEYRVQKAIQGTPRPSARGKLNPSHISWLAYALSTKEIKPENLRRLLKNGTSLSTIASLTNISEATLHRWRKQ